VRFLIANPTRQAHSISFFDNCNDNGKEEKESRASSSADPFGGWGSLLPIETGGKEATR
jgi:hypothetical protein